MKDFADESFKTGSQGNLKMAYYRPSENQK